MASFSGDCVGVGGEECVCVCVCVCVRGVGGMGGG